MRAPVCLSYLSARPPARPSAYPSQALINVVDAMLSQRTTGAETALHALDALATAALCPLVRAALLDRGCPVPRVAVSSRFQILGCVLYCTYPPRPFLGKLLPRCLAWR